MTYSKLRNNAMVLIKHPLWTRLKLYVKGCFGKRAWCFVETRMIRTFLDIDLNLALKLQPLFAQMEARLVLFCHLPIINILLTVFCF